jgi:hypothetical protein
MCNDPDCDGINVPPPGENWCPRRLDIELIRWFTGFPMKCGEAYAADYYTNVLRGPVRND